MKRNVRGERRFRHTLSSSHLNASKRPRKAGQLERAAAAAHLHLVEALEPRQLLSSTPLISEFLAINNNNITDENGDHSDWLEIHNPAAADVNLNGYFLTDSTGDLTKWQLPAVTVPSGGYLVVFADAKDRRALGSNLHTNFSLSGGGGYLGLVAPDGHTVLSDYNYPQQVADKSYGVPVSENVTTLLSPTGPAKTLVPQNGNLGSGWTAPAFDDSSWTSGTLGVGYETGTAGGNTGSGFAVRMVDTSIGDFSNIGTATNLLNGTTTGYTIASDTTATRSVINLGDGGDFANDLAYPNGTGGTSADNGSPGRTEFAIRATANVTIPQGTYTIDVNSDDGFRLTIPGVTFTNRSNENFTGATNPSPANTLTFGGTRGPGDTFATFTVPAGGLSTSLQLDMFEQQGGDEVELSLAQGQRTSFSTSTFQLLADGTFGWGVKDPTSPFIPNYRSLIGTDTQAAMLNKQNTAYVRVPFNVPDTGDFDSVRFQMKYDDGYVAYLNGQEIARRNAPATPTWNSAATAAHDDNAALNFESIEIPNSDLVEGTNVLAIQGLNAANDQPDFLIDPSIQGILTQVGTETYFSNPTPGAANGTATSVGFVGDTHFNVHRGFYTSPFQLTITDNSPGASIRYTTDGTAPTASYGTLYTGPVTISQTTTIRAVAYATGLNPSNVDTETYIFMSDVIHQEPTGAAPPGFPSTSVNGQTFNYGMDPNIVNSDPNLISQINSVPSVSLVMDPNDLFNAGSGIYVNAGNHGRAWERPGSIEFLYPDGTTQDIQSNAGVRIRGGFSRSGDNPKHAFRFFFRSQYGNSSFDYPIFGPTGASSYQGFDLRTSENYSWSFQGDSRYTGITDTFSRDTQRAMGWQGTRGNYYNLYINGQYWGQYETDERPEADFGANYFGGSASDYDTIKVAPDQGYNIEATDGNLDAWTSLWTQVQGDLSGSAQGMANYQKLLGNNPDGTRNPTYPVLLDPNNLIDYMLVIYYTGNLDAPLSAFLSEQSPNNFYALRNRNGNMGFQFFAHDSEHTFLNVNEDRTGPGAGSAVGPNNGWPVTSTSVSKSNPQWMFEYLMSNPEFKQLFADHVQKAFADNGVLTPASVGARLGVRRDQITNDVYGESARWGDSKHSPAYTHDTWQAEINSIYNSFIPQRSAIVLQQFRSRGWLSTTTPSSPVFSQFGGTVPAGFKLTIGNPNGSGTIYYTLDGTDPRGLGSGIAATAVAYTGPVTISQTRRVRARVFNSTTNTWSALEDATFTLSSSNLHVTEMMYHPAPPPAGSPYTADDFEYLELYNSGTTDIDLSGMQFNAGITYTFPASTTLAAGARGVVVKNPAAFQSRYGAGATILGTYSDKLSDSGEEVRLVTATGATVFDYTYSDSWYPDTDGGGYSLVVRNPTADPSTLSSAAAWQPSNDLNGSPGNADTGTAPGSVVINEVLAHPDTGGDDWIELRNTTNSPVNIGGWFLSDSGQNLTKYQIPVGTTVPANGYLVFYSSSSFGTAGNPGVNTPFRLSSGGDSVHLTSVDAANNPGGYQEKQDFTGSDLGVTLGRYTNSAGQTDFVALTAPTPGGDNSAPAVGPVVINEMNYFPLTGQEFIELRNITGQAQPLYDPQNPQNAWKFTNGIDYTFPAGASIPAFGYALVVGGDPTQFRTQNNIPASVPIYGPYTGADGSNVLSNGGERVTLSKPGTADPTTGILPYIDVDTVNYGVAAPWPSTPDGTGPTLTRINSLAFGDEPTNWKAGPTNGTPGAANLTNTAPVVNAFPGGTTQEGGTYNAHGTFTDPDLDPAGSWTATVDYGDGTGAQPLVLNGKSFDLSHTYGANTPPGSTGTYTVTVTVTDVAGASASAGATVTVNPGAASVKSVVINDGSAQRSKITSVTVTFDRVVALDAGAFSLAGRNGAGAGTAVSAANPSGDGKTWVLTFSGAPVVNGSLADGIYDLTVVGSKVHAGSAAGLTMPADYHAAAFHRLYGDSDGDGDVDALDLFQFQKTLNKHPADAGYLWYLDYDGNGNVDAVDLFQVRSRLALTFKGY